MKIYDRAIEINEMTRSGEIRKKVDLILVCPFYTEEIIKYIESLKYQDEKYLSYNYIIEESGKILNIIPDQEISYPTSNIELDLLSLSVGVFIKEKGEEVKKRTKSNLILLLRMLCLKYNLKADKNIKIAYDIFNTREFEYYIDNYFAWKDIIREIGEDKK